MSLEQNEMIWYGIVKSKKEKRINMSDEEKRWPFDGFYLKLAEAQREYDQEQHIDPVSLTEEE